MVYSRNQCITIVHPNGNFPILLVRSKNKLDSSHEQSYFHFKDEHWFLTKGRVEIVSSCNQRINIVYLNGNYQFLFICHEKNLILVTKEVHSFLERTLIPKKMKGSNSFFSEPMHQYRASQWELPISFGPSQKETRFLPRKKFNSF